MTAKTLDELNIQNLSDKINSILSMNFETEIEMVESMIQLENLREQIKNEIRIFNRINYPLSKLGSCIGNPMDKTDTKYHSIRIIDSHWRNPTEFNDYGEFIKFNPAHIQSKKVNSMAKLGDTKYPLVLSIHTIDSEDLLSESNFSFFANHIILDDKGGVNEWI